MTIESDLEAFRDLALERQIRIQSSSASRTEIISSVYKDLDPLLEEIIGETPVLISGTVFNAHRFPEGFNINPDTLTTSAFGESEGLLVADRSIIEPVDSVTPEALIIGFLITQTNNDSTREYVFAPVENCSISAPELELYSADSITPDAHDEVAEYIDSCLLDEEINFTVLTAIFDSIGDNELSVDYYLKYVNLLLDTSDYVFEFTSDCLIQVTENPTYENVMQPNTTFKTTCNPERFTYIPEAGGLCIMFKTSDGSGKFLVPIRTLYSGHFTAKK